MKTGMKLLIVDDDDRNIFALKAVLTARGCHCVTASGGAQALAVLAQTAADAVLVDMMMPEMDGYEFMSRVRQNAAQDQLVLVAVTAQAMPGDKEKCLAAGADAYISKPVNIDQLMTILNNLVRS